MKAREFNLILFGISFLLPLFVGLFVGGFTCLTVVVFALAMRYVEDLLIKRFGDKIER